MERAAFVRQFEKNMDKEHFRVEVDGEYFCVIAFTDEKTYNQALNSCETLVEEDEKFAGRKISSSYMCTDRNLIRLYTMTSKEDWWTL